MIVSFSFLPFLLFWHTVVYLYLILLTDRNTKSPVWHVVDSFLWMNHFWNSQTHDHYCQSKHYMALKSHSIFNRTLHYWEICLRTKLTCETKTKQNAGEPVRHPPDTYREMIIRATNHCLNISCFYSLISLRQTFSKKCLIHFFFYKRVSQWNKHCLNV